MEHIQKSPKEKINQPDSKTTGGPGKSLAPPAFQLKCDEKGSMLSSGTSKAKQAPIQKQSASTLDERVVKAQTDLLVGYRNTWHQCESKVLQSIATSFHTFFDPNSSHHLLHFQTATALLEIRQVLRERMLKAGEGYPDPELFKMVGETPPTVAGMAIDLSKLDKMAPFDHVQDWQTHVENYGQDSWNSDRLGEAFNAASKSPTQEGKGVSIEEYRSHIGKKTLDANGKDDAPGIKTAYDWAMEKQLAGKPDAKQKEVVRHTHFHLDRKGLLDGILKGTVLRGALAQQDPVMVEKFLHHLNKSVRAAGIDTVEAQAVFLSHAGVEAQMFFLTEGQKRNDRSHPSGSQPIVPINDDPSKISIYIDSGWKLTDYIDEDGQQKSEMKFSEVEGPVDYDTGHKRRADPAKNIDRTKRGDAKAFAEMFQQTMIGRGVFQTIFPENYVRTLIYMEEMAKMMDEKKDYEHGQLLREAVVAIKLDPSKAADPKYSYLFSAAYMHSVGGLESIANSTHDNYNFLGADGASAWVAGGDITSLSEHFIVAAGKKARIYKQARDFLLKQAKATQ